MIGTPVRIALLTAAALLSKAAVADVDRGGDVFDEACSECHSVAKPLKNKKGPGLLGVVGRKAATVPDFHYSEALSASGIVWTPEEIDTYLRAPKARVPGGKMKFDGLDKASERRDLIEFLDTQR